MGQICVEILAMLVLVTLGVATSKRCNDNTDCNHGNCTLAGQCQCPTGFTGGHCQIPICHNACQNGGHCILPGKCSCPLIYTGEHCESCISNIRRFCPTDATCSRFEHVPGKCCPRCVRRKWETTCPPGPCRPVPGCRQYEHTNSSGCCPQCIKYDQSCLGETCNDIVGCEEYALRVPRGRCCPRCARYQCSRTRCPAVDGCIRYDSPWQGLCCPRCVAYRSACAGVKCPATRNCAKYQHKPGKCCATCKRLGILRKRLTGDSPCSGVICPSGKICHVERGKAFCRCRFSCSKKKRPVCGSDGATYRNRCRLQRMACLQAVNVKPVHTIFCNFFASKIHSHLSRVKSLNLKGGIFLANNRPS